MFVNLVTWNCGCWLILTVFTFCQPCERKQWNNQNDFERFIFASYNTKFVISLSYWRMESSTFIFICVTFYLAVRQLSNVVLFLKANMCWSLSHFETINSKKNTKNSLTPLKVGVLTQPTCRIRKQKSSTVQNNFNKTPENKSQQKQ